ncbi:flagellar hook-length control protein FliK [Noviherbaspirillum malthae]|uniref:flagellar hook-length control protein FliK n=1 Tax=Noviherbaspirillum malthae TaxID=1260987 RepID=UPI00189098AE|nr:flagellar hook-length control protein FliK [Noviherbaspirillum malthae]
MQTSQVTNPANLFTGTTPAGKPADTSNANPAQSFGQLLSREVAGRQQNTLPKTQSAPAPAKTQQPASANASATSSAASQQAAARPASDARQPAKVKGAEEKDAAKEDVSDAKANSAASPDDLLAMVADLVQMTTAASTDASALGEQQNDQAAVDPALLLAASGMLRPEQAAAHPEKTEIVPDAHAGGKPLALDADAARAGAKDMPADLAARPDTGSGAAEDLASLAAKGQELLMNPDSDTAPANFGAALQETQNQVPAPMQSIPQMAHAVGRTPETKAAERLTPAVGSAGWDQALGQKVVWMVTGEQQSASLTLNPPDLGPLQIVLNVSNSQANATFTAAQPEVRQALEAAMPKLRDMLGEAGIQLGQATVNSGSPNQQSQQNQQNPSFASRQGQGNGESGGTTIVNASRAVPSSGGTGMVDTFV